MPPAAIAVRVVRVTVIWAFLILIFERIWFSGTVVATKVIFDRETPNFVIKCLTTSVFFVDFPKFNLRELKSSQGLLEMRSAG